LGLQDAQVRGRGDRQPRRLLPVRHPRQVSRQRALVQSAYGALSRADASDAARCSPDSCES
jgi:hypothetical protein